MKADASAKDALSHVESAFKYKLTDDVRLRLSVGTPHRYALRLQTDFKDRFRDSAAKLDLFKLQADVECDEQAHAYPSTFHARFVFAKMVALHAQVMTERGNNLEAQVDLMGRLTKTLYGGGELVYDDQARALVLSRYGVFWKARKHFTLGLEYLQKGDRHSVEGSVYHKASYTTKVGSHFSYDCDHKRVAATTAVEKQLDEKTTVQARVDNLGACDFLLKGQLSPTLEATFSAGANASAFFHGKTHDEAYTGLRLKFTL